MFVNFFFNSKITIIEKLLKTKYINTIYFTKNFVYKNSEFYNFLNKNNYKYLIVEKSKIRSICSNNSEIVAKINNYEYKDWNHMKSLILNNKINNLILLDKITDSHNFGAIIRTCMAFDFQNILVFRNNTATINNHVLNASAGYLYDSNIYLISNIVSLIKFLKTQGFWIISVTADENDNNYLLENTDFRKYEKKLLIFGNETKGISNVIQNNSDILLKINTSRYIESLNVNIAAGIILNYIYMQTNKV